MLIYIAQIVEEKFIRMLTKRRMKPMKCPKCHRHWKHVRNLDHIVSICPDCFAPYDAIAQTKELFDKILAEHIATAELRDMYRIKLEAILKQINIIL